MNIYKCLLFAAVAMSGASCTGSFDDINTNHHEATEDMLDTDNLRVGAFFSQMQQRVVLFKDGTGGAESSDYQVAQGLTADLYSGYIAATGTWRSGRTTSAYYMVDGWYNQMFSRGFSEVMTAWQKVHKTCEEKNMPVASAVADIVKVEAMHRVTDMYGPIPYTTFGSGTIGATYDTQETVYKKFFEELDNAIDVLTPYAETGAQTLSDYDFVYGGDIASWVRFANTLRLRLAMRVVYADASLAKTEAEKSVSNSVGVIETSAQRAELQHGKLNYFHPNYDIAYTFNDGEARMNASMDSYMNGYNDPRLPKYFKTASADGKYHGVRLGVQNMLPSKYAGSSVSNLNVDNSSTPIVWMTAAESYFLRAEGALRGWNMGGTAQEFYEAGIKMSFEENSAGSADNYISNSTNTPANYEDPTGDSNSHSAMSQITVKWEDGDFEKSLERIITQKWIAVYPDGPEGWAEYRRTGYPKLFPVVTNYSSSVVSSDTQIRRCPFPTTEYNTNPEGVQTGVTALGGADNIGTRLWWDKKN